MEGKSEPNPESKDLTPKEVQEISSPTKTESPDLKQDQDDDEGKQDEASGGSTWWGYSSWMDKAVSSVSTVVESAKQKSNEVYDLVAKDLEEVSGHATTMVKSSSTSIKKTLEWDWYYCDPNLPICGGDDQAGHPATSLCSSMMPDVDLDEKSDVLADKTYVTVKKSVSSAWRYAAGYATQMFTEEDLESEALLVQGQQEPVILNRLQAQLYALASDPESFLAEPHQDDTTEYETWKCDLDRRQGEISDLMVNNPKVRQNYSTLVPEQVTHKLFWTRYFFKVHLIELQENRRQVLKKRAAEATKDDDEEINWDDVADLADNPVAAKISAAENDEEIPDEVQDRLLKDYERELIAAKVNPVTNDNLSNELRLKEKQISPDKDEVSSDDWEKLSTGEKSPRKSSKDEEEEWVQP